MSAVPIVQPSLARGSAAQPVRPRAERFEPASAPRLHSAGLIAAGQTLPVPRLDRIPLHHQSFGSDAAAARFASLLLEADIAHAADWRVCDGNPLQFIRRTIQRFVRDHGEAAIDQAFDVSVSFSDSPLGLFETDEEPNGSLAFLYMEAGSCGFVNLGPVLTILEKAHAGLPATFGNLLLDAIGRWFRTYDHRDASERIDNLEDTYDPQEDADALAALPNRDDVLPAFMKRKPIGRDSLRLVLSRLSPQSQAARIMRSVQKLDKISQRAERLPVPPELAEVLSDMNPPVPVLLAIFHDGDPIET